MKENFLFVYLTVVLVILFSLQYTLNRILKILFEIKNMKKYDVVNKNDE